MHENVRGWSLCHCFSALSGFALGEIECWIVSGILKQDRHIVKQSYTTCWKTYIISVFILCFQQRLTSVTLTTKDTTVNRFASTQ